MNSRRAALPRSSHAHGTRRRAMAIDREVDEPRDDGIVLQAEDAAEVAWRHAGADQQQEQARQLPDGADQLLLVAGAEDEVAERDRTADVEPEQVLRGQHPAHLPPSSDGELPGAAREHVDRRLDRELGRRDRRDGARANRRTGASSAAGVAVTAARISASVIDADLRVAEVDEQRGNLGEPPRGLAGSSPPAHRRSAGCMIIETGVVPRSSSPWTVCPVPVRRVRIVIATYVAPASVPRTRRAVRPDRGTRRLERSRARTVKVGAIPVSSDA